jgi:Ser/Thr protein kinase RdoA (MazF antagonist)
VRRYDDLTAWGKIRRLHGLARRALLAYDVEVTRLRCVARDTNTTFRVDTAAGGPLALRVATRDTDTLVHTPTELAWLDALADHPQITVPSPHPNRMGQLVTVVSDAGVPGARRCVLFDWLRGRPIGDDATPVDYRGLGRLSALLHQHGRSWRLPAGSEPLVWDRVFYYPTEPVVLYDESYRGLMTPERTAVVKEVEERAGQELERLHREVPVSICHGDLHPWNVMRFRGRLAVFDFEDLMVAAPVQDIATTLFYNRDHADYPALVTAFEEGYREVEVWPVEWDGQLQLLMAARTVMFINYVLRLGLDPEEYVPMAVERVSRVLDRSGGRGRP